MMSGKRKFSILAAVSEQNFTVKKMKNGKDFLCGIIHKVFFCEALINALLVQECIQYFRRGF